MKQKCRFAVAVLLLLVILCGALPTVAAAAPDNSQTKEAELIQRFDIKGEVSIGALNSGKYIAVFVDDASGRNQYNKEAAYYSIYNGSSWSQPVMLEDDGTKDYMPTISDLGNGKLFIAWSDSNKVFDAGSTYEEVTNGTNIMGVFVDKATAAVSDMLVVTKSTNEENYGDENAYAVYDPATDRMIIFYNKSEHALYNGVDEPYTTLCCLVYDMANEQFIEFGSSIDLDGWYHQAFVGTKPSVMVEETLDADGFWTKDGEAYEFGGEYEPIHTEYHAVYYNGKAILAYVLDYDTNSGTTNDRDIFIKFYDFAQDKMSTTFAIAYNNVEESDVHFEIENGTVYLCYRTNGSPATFNVSDNFSRSTVLVTHHNDDYEFLMLNKSKDSGYLPPHVCALTLIPQNAPSCTDGGKKAYYKCEDCGKCFEQADGATKIPNIESWGELTKNGHTEGSVWEKDGTDHWHVCTVTDCGAVIENSKTAHTPDRAAATDTAPIKCSVCGYIMAAQLNHTHEFNKEVALDQYKASEASCTEPAKYYKSCACGEAGTETFASGSANTHTHGAEWKSDSNNHWNECTCGDKANAAAHKDENADGKCDACSYTLNLTTPPADTNDQQSSSNDQQQTGDNNQSEDDKETNDNIQSGTWIVVSIVIGIVAIATILFFLVKKKRSVR